MKKKISLFLALLCLLSALVSCGGGNPAVTTARTETAQTTDAPITLSPNETLVLPESHNFDGTDFTILSTAIMTNPPTPFRENENYSGVVNEAVFNRNAKIEDEFGIVIGLVEDYSNQAGAAITKLQANRSAGDTLYDAGMIAVFDTSKLAYQDYLADMADVPFVCLEKVWWDQNANKEIAINGKVYYTTGDISFNDKEYTFATIFNKGMAATAGITDLYELAESGKWTLDKLAEYSSLVLEDLNGDDKYDENDRYGFMMWNSLLTAQINAAGETIGRVVDDKLTITLQSDAVASVVSDYVALLNKPSTVNFQSTKAITAQWIPMVQNNQVLFVTQYLKALINFNEVDIEFGILPMPKYNEEQERYYCGLAGYQACMYCIPADCADLEMSGMISEAMAAYSRTTVTPAYIDRSLKGRYAQDEESVAMLNTIFDSRIYDLGLFYRIGTLDTVLSNICSKKVDTFSSDVARFAVVAKKQADNINKYFNGEQ